MRKLTLFYTPYTKNIRRLIEYIPFIEDFHIQNIFEDFFIFCIYGMYNKCDLTINISFHLYFLLLLINNITSAYHRYLESNLNIYIRHSSSIT